MREDAAAANAAVEWWRLSDFAISSADLSKRRRSIHFSQQDASMVRGEASNTATEQKEAAAVGGRDRDAMQVE